MTTTLRRVTAASLLLSVSVSASAGVASDAASMPSPTLSPASAIRASSSVQGSTPVSETIPNLQHPAAQLFTAGQPEAQAWPALARSGVRTVINLRPEAEMAGRDEPAEVAAAGMAYHSIPVDGADGLTLESAHRLWTLLQQAEGDVLVHCASANRAGALLAIAAARHDGLAPEEAIAFGRAAGMTGTEARVREVLGAAQAPPE